MFNLKLPRLGGLILLLVHLCLVACSESEHDGGITGTGSPLESYLKHGMAAHNQRGSGCVQCMEEPVLESDTSADGEKQTVSDGFSKTNTQEQGVDELDWLKTDGEFIYSYNGSEHINVFGLTDLVGKKDPVNTITLDIERQYLRGLYLDESSNDKQLITVADQYEHTYSDYFWYWSESKSRINIYDLATPESSIKKNVDIVLDGQYISSRKIGSKLYVVSQFSAQLDDYVIHPFTEEQVERNLKRINDASLDDLLPSISINGDSAVLLNSTDCHIPVDPEEATRPTLAIVTVIDLDKVEDLKPSDVNASCVAAPISTIYSSLNAVYMVENEYLIGNQDGRYNAHIYKINLQADSIAYSDSITLKGNIGWNNQFRLSEYQGYLRVVTTDHSASENNVHRLHMVEITESGLALASSIPNAEDSTPIGKPGESIYSVRFSKDKAYVVTFRRIDPFYVLDLSNPLLPKVAGELELPGFSNYLHPFGDALVFGLGRGAETGNATDQIKVALFDVSDMTQPVLVDDYVLEGNDSYTPALYSHTALSILPASDNQSWRLGFSASIYENWTWQREAYFLFDINSETESQTASMSLAGEVLGSDDNSDSDKRYYSSSYDRGVITGTHVHYSHNNTLITELWDELSASE